MIGNNTNRKKFHCESCHYYTDNKYDYIKHQTTAKHKNSDNYVNSAIKTHNNIANIYSCILCDFNTSNKNHYNKHLLTRKHIGNTERKKNTNDNLNLSNVCNVCNKEYLNYNALWKHKKKCVVSHTLEDTKLQNTFTPTNNIIPDIFLEVLKESKELQQVLIEQNKDLQNKLLEKENKLLEKDNILIEQNNKIIELASKQTSNTNINSHNKTNNFNLQFYLNETCKDAMNIVDFVNSLQLTTDDFETTGKLGFVDGISRIFIKELKKLDTEKLPIHCTDFKRETVYIKDNNTWEKETDEKKRVKWAIDSIAQLNLNQIQQWQEKYPECKENNTRANDHFFGLAKVALGGRGKEEEDKLREKIIRNVLKEVVLNKK